MPIGSTLSPIVSERRSDHEVVPPPSVSASPSTKAKSEALVPMKPLAPGAELPNFVYRSVVLCFAWMLLGAWFAFGRDRETDFSLAIVSVFSLVVIGILFAMRHTVRQRLRQDAVSAESFTGSSVDTATGNLPATDVWIQILIIPFALALAATAIGAAFLFES